MPTESPNVGIAFALVAGAGSATALGASVVFFPTLVKFANRTTLAAALGLSAGVMTYVSFVEIFRKSVLSFEADGYTEEAYMFATLCFFGGVIFMVVSRRGSICKEAEERQLLKQKVCHRWSLGDVRPLSLEGKSPSHPNTGLCGWR